MPKSRPFRERLTQLDEDYLDPLARFFQEQTVKAGKRYVIKPFTQLLSEIANSSVDAAFDVADHFHRAYDSAREKVKDRKGRQRVKDGARELRSIIIEKALDVGHPIDAGDVNELYQRVLFLNHVVQMLNMSDEVNLFPEEFEQLRLRISEGTSPALQLPYEEKGQPMGALRYLAQWLKM